MQKYRGIVMGRRKINNSEAEAEIEGSGDDHEPQGLALLVTEFGKFQQNMNRTESTLVDSWMSIRKPTEGDRPKSLKP
jgi:hypothetical protein